jgi:hypothetical protein
MFFHSGKHRMCQNHLLRYSGPERPKRRQATAAGLGANLKWPHIFSKPSAPEVLVAIFWAAPHALVIKKNTAPPYFDTDEPFKTDAPEVLQGKCWDFGPPSKDRLTGKMGGAKEKRRNWGSQVKRKRLLGRGER